MKKLSAVFAVAALATVSMTASAWWGGPWGNNGYGDGIGNGYGNGYARGYGRGYDYSGYPYHGYPYAAPIAAMIPPSLENYAPLILAAERRAADGYGRAA